MKTYFKDSESMIDTIFSEWSGQIKKSENANLHKSFVQLQYSFDKFKEQLETEGYEGYFSNKSIAKKI